MPPSSDDRSQSTCRDHKVPAEITKYLHNILLQRMCEAGINVVWRLLGPQVYAHLKGFDDKSVSMYLASRNIHSHHAYLAKGHHTCPSRDIIHVSPRTSYMSLQGHHIYIPFQCHCCEVKDGTQEEEKIEIDKEFTSVLAQFPYLITYIVRDLQRRKYNVLLIKHLYQEYATT